MQSEQSIARMASYCLTALGVKFDHDVLTADVMEANEITKAPPIGIGLLVAYKHQNSVPDCATAARELSNLLASEEKQPVEISRLKRTDIGEIHGKQVETMQEVVAKKLAAHFRKSVRDTANRIAKRSDKPQAENAEKQAETIIKATFNLEDARKDLFERASKILPVVFAAGAMAELEIGVAVDKQTTAEEIAARLEIDTALLSSQGVTIGRMPDWMLGAAREEMGEMFAQDYWQEVDETTRDDIQRTLEQGIEDGLSMKKLAKAINEKHGGLYSLTRAIRVARTETPNALLAGHNATLDQLEEDTGLKIGKEWIAAFQTFSRGSHLALDGTQTKTADGKFDLNGVKIPWPAHYDLPAKDRINCLCNFVSVIAADQLE